jgi:hypothetical protein
LVIAEPPSLPGVQERVTCKPVFRAVKPVGGLGTVAALAYAEKDRKLSKNIENRKPERKNIIVRLVFVVLFAEGAFTRSLVT